MQEATALSIQSTPTGKISTVCEEIRLRPAVELPIGQGIKASPLADYQISPIRLNRLFEGIFQCHLKTHHQPLKAFFIGRDARGARNGDRFGKGCKPSGPLRLLFQFTDKRRFAAAQSAG